MEHKVADTAPADYVIPATVTYNGDNYIYEALAQGSAPLTGTVQQDGETINVILQYTKDNWNDGTDAHDDGDDIPDKYQVTITFASSNDSYGTVNKTIEVKTIPGNVSTGDVPIDAEATKVDNRAYFSNWTLDGAEIGTDLLLGYTIANAEGGKVYNVIANFGKNSGGGGGGSVSTGNAKLVKVDANDEDYRIPGVVFELYKKNGNLVGKYTTDSKGEINVSKLTVGEYYWKEILPAEGYHNDHTHHNFKVSANQTTCVTVKNTHSSVSEDFSNDHFAYIIGYNDGLVHPEKQVTRAEFAAIAARFDHDGDATDTVFTDIYENWGHREINIAANNGWVLGYEDGTFKPDTYITRAEAMAMVNRVLQRLPETKDDLVGNMITWPDNKDTGKWYYLTVQEATNSHDYDRKSNGYEKWTALRDVRDWSELED